MTDTETFLWIIVAFLAVVILFILMKKGGCRGGMQRLDSDFDNPSPPPPPPPPMPRRFMVGDVVEVIGQPTREFTIVQDVGPRYSVGGRRSWQYRMSYSINGVPTQIVMSDSNILRKIR